MDNYYNATFCIAVTSTSHDICLFEFNRIKYLAKAMHVSFHESKSGKKLPILSRSIQIEFAASEHALIIFREALDLIVESINNSDINTAKYYNESVEPCHSPFRPVN